MRFLPSVAVVVLVAFLSGCVGSAGSSGNPSGPSEVDPNALPPVDENEGRIVGTVTDDSLAPIADAQVGLLDADPRVVVSTNQAGKYAMVGLVPGKYAIGVQKLGYESSTRQVDVVAGQAVEVNFMVNPIAVETGKSRYFTKIGDGYFACGADVGYGNQGLSWGNLHACVFDQHHPNVTFEPEKADFKGVLDEVTWSQSSGFTSQRLSVTLVYGHSCTPFCDAVAEWGAPDDGYGDSVSKSPVRIYIPFTQDMIDTVKEDPMPLKSVTFPNRDDQPIVIVFQQRMTHYISQFWGPLPYAEEDMLSQFTAIPDA